MENLVAYARKVEGDMYESANTRVRNLHMVSKGLNDVRNKKNSFA